jgi:hypothetical protein
MEEGAAIATFLLDLQRANAVWSRNAQMGGRAALLAAMRLCHALGEAKLDMPFRVMGEGLIDLEKGKYPVIFHRNTNGADTTNTIAEQNLQADIVCHLEALCKGAGMKQKEAAEVLASIIEKRGISPVTKKPSHNAANKPTWKRISDLRNEMIRPGSKSSHELREKVFNYTEGMLATLGEVPPAERRERVLRSFRRALVEHEQLVPKGDV